METAGVAPIKAQYLTTKEKFHAYLDQEGERRNCQGDGKDARKDICTDLTEPPAKLQKTEEGDGDAEEGKKWEDANKAEGGRKAGEDNKAEDGVTEEDGSKTEEGWKVEDGSKVHGSKKEDGGQTEDGNKVHGSMKEDGSKADGSKTEDGNEVHGSIKEDGSKKEDSNKVHGSMEEDGSKVHGSMKEDGSKVHGSMKEDGSKVHGSMKEEGNKAEDGVKEVDDTKREESQKTEGGNKAHGSKKDGSKADDSVKEDGNKAPGSMKEEGNKAEDGVMEVDGNKEEEGNKADGSPREEEGSKREEGNPPEEVSGNARARQGRKRARGQNKIRPCLKPAEYEKHRLCPSIVQDRGGKCLFGSRCNYVHDVKEYVALKPPDLGGACILFSTFGKCPYGITCRFAGAHTGKDHENVVNQELAKAWEGKTLVKNILGKELQHQLRKKKFPFVKATEYLCRMAKVVEAKGAERQATLSYAGEPEFANSPAANRGYTHNAPIWSMPQGSCIYPREDPTSVNWKGPSQQPPPLIPHLKRVGAVTDEDRIKIRPCEKRKLDLSGKLYLAPLTTCGNLPFRRVCKKFGADITCGEMAVCTNLLQGQTSEWALLKRHHTEDIFGVQLEGSFPDTMTKCAELLNKRVEVDFVDINAGCPIDLVYNKGGGAALMNRMTKFEQIVRGMNYVLDVPLTVKIRTGVQEKTNLAHKLIPNLREWGVSLVTLHGRSREQRYTKAANWSYIEECTKLANPMPLFGNGDILSFEDASQAMQRGVSGVMIARGALIKPWIFTEIKERRHWDISSGERLEILKDFTNYGLEQWGSDTQGVEKTRRFLLEWLSFLCRYIPVGLLERLPQRINERPPYYMGRDYLETLMASQNAGDWIKISEILLGPVLPNFTFLPKHKANSYK